MKKGRIAWMALALALALSLFSSTALAEGNGNGKTQPKPKPTKTEKVKPTKSPKLMHVRWGEIEQAQMDALKLSYNNVEALKTQLKLKIKEIARNRAALGQAIDSLKESGIALTEEQITSLETELAKVSVAHRAMQSARHDIVKAKKAYLDARKNRDAAAATAALDELKAKYEIAITKAGDVSACLMGIKDIVLGMVAAPTTAPEATSAAPESTPAAPESTPPAE